MRLVRSLLCELWENKILKVAYFIFNIGYIAVHLYFLIYSLIDETEPFSYLGITLRFVLVYFIFFLFFSYEYFGKTETVGFSECASSVFCGKAKLFYGQLTVLLLCILPMFVIITALNFLVVFIQSQDAAYALHVILHMVINYLLLPCLGILTGAAVSLKFKRLQAYGILLLFSIIVSPSTEILMRIIYISSGKSFNISNIFYIFTPSVEWTPIPAYGYSLQPYRIAVILFWFFLSLLCVFFSLSKLQKRSAFRTAAAICLIVCVSCATLTALPNSDLILNSKRPNSAAFLSSDYYKHVSVSEHPADFQVEKYELNLKFNRILQANVTMKLAETDLEEYRFTLYHDYQIKRVTDENGCVLEFTQNADYVTIYANSDTLLNSITISYSGYNPTFYSNSQGAFLPGYFAYYPIPGHNEIFTVYSATALHYNRTKLTHPAEFSLKISGDGEFYTNLSETDENEYSGTSSGLTIMSGFYKSTQVGNTRIIYPYYKMTENDVHSFYSSFLSDKDYKTVMCVPNVNLNYYLSCVEFEDYLLASANILDVEDQYIMRDIRPEKLESIEWNLYAISSH